MGEQVFWSFIIQAGIAIIALLALLVFDVWYSFKRIKEKVQIDRMIVALVDFHKAQCYFASVIQIAALTLFHKSKNGSAEAYNYSSNPHAFRDLFDSSVLIFLATCGLIPINLTLACVSIPVDLTCSLIFTPRNAFTSTLLSVSEELS